jgi:hypothetical protein
VTPEITARLADCGILMAAEAKEHCMFVRGNCMALVRTAADGSVSLGSSGFMTEKGLAYLVWQDGKAMLSSHGSQVEADAAQLEAIGKFSEELKRALAL